MAKVKVSYRLESDVIQAIAESGENPADYISKSVRRFTEETAVSEIPAETIPDPNQVTVVPI